MRGHVSLIRSYALMSGDMMGDPGRRHHGGFVKKLGRSIRKFHPSGLTKGLLLGAATLPFGGLGALGAVGRLGLRAAPALLRGSRALGGLGFRGARGAVGAARGLIGRSRGSVSDISRELASIADDFGVDPDTLASAAVDEGVIDESDLEGDAFPYGDVMGDPARRSKRARGARGGRHAATAAHGGGKLAALKSLAGSLASGVPSEYGIGQPPLHDGLALHRRHRLGKHRRINPTNVHALKRSIRRVIAFEKVAARTTTQLRKMVTKAHLPGVRAHHSHRGKHGHGCKCATCR